MFYFLSCRVNFPHISVKICRIKHLIKSLYVMLLPTEFLHKQETDVILLQEVTPIEFELIRGYNAYTNVGINKRGNGMLTRQTIKVTYHAVTIRAGNGILLRRCLYSKYMYTIWIIE